MVELRQRGIVGRASTQRRRLSEHGAVSVELVIIAPVMAIIILLLVAAGRIAMAGLSAESAAAAASRAASLEVSATEANTVAVETATATLIDEGLNCSGLNVAIDASVLDAPRWTSGSVTVTVTCTVPMSDIALPGLGGSQTLVATASSPVDPFRERG